MALDGTMDTACSLVFTGRYSNGRLIKAGHNEEKVFLLLLN